METTEYTDGKSREELELLAKEVARSLGGVTNKEQVVIHGMGRGQSFTITELIEEVENLTSVGLEYINMYYGGVEAIKEIKEKRLQKAKRKRDLFWTLVWGIFVLIVICSLIGAYMTMGLWWDKISIPIFK